MVKYLAQTRARIILCLMLLVSLFLALPAANARNAVLLESRSARTGNQDDGSREAQGSVKPEDNVSIELAIDDGSFENAIGLTLGGRLFAVNRLTPPNYPATLTDVRLFFRTERSGGVAVGDPVLVIAGAHPSGSDNIDLTQFQALNTTIPVTGQFATYDVPDVTINSGDFVVGFSITHPRGQFPIALDGTILKRLSYVSTTGVTFTHIEDAALALIGNFGIRAVVRLNLNCTYALASTSQTFAKTGGNGKINITAPAGCSWNATTPANWITFTAAGGNGNGAVSYFVAGNTGVGRATSINVAGQVFTVTQTDTLAPMILNIQAAGKKLLVGGMNFDDGASIFIDGSLTKKVFNDADNPTTLLVARKAGNFIGVGQTVNVQVVNKNGVPSDEVKFTRPAS